MRQKFYLPADFEIKYVRAKRQQKDFFFDAIQAINFHVHVVVVRQLAMAVVSFHLLGSILVLLTPVRRRQDALSRSATAMCSLRARWDPCRQDRRHVRNAKAGGAPIIASSMFTPLASSPTALRRRRQKTLPSLDRRACRLDIVDEILAAKGITPEKTAPEEFARTRRCKRMAWADRRSLVIRTALGRPCGTCSRGPARIGVSFVNYLDELPYFCAEVLRG